MLHWHLMLVQDASRLQKKIILKFCKYRWRVGLHQGGGNWNTIYAVENNSICEYEIATTKRNQLHGVAWVIKENQNIICTKTSIKMVKFRSAYTRYLNFLDNNWHRLMCTGWKSAEKCSDHNLKGVRLGINEQGKKKLNYNFFLTICIFFWTWRGLEIIRNPIKKKTHVSKS